MQFWKRNWIWLLLIAVVAVAMLVEPAAACPTCKDSIAQQDPQQANMVRGYFWSILFMMSMPFLLLGSFSLYMWWEVHKARLKTAEEAAGESRAESSPLNKLGPSAGSAKIETPVEVA